MSGDPHKLTKAEIMERARSRRSQPSSTIEAKPGESHVEGPVELTKHEDADTKRKRLENAKFDRMMGASEDGGNVQRLSKSQKRRRRRRRLEMRRSSI